MRLTDTESAQQMVRFRISSDTFLTPVSTIDEVADPVEFTPLPATVGWFKGLATIKGRLIPVSDLGDFAGLGASADSVTAKWLVINSDAETFAVIVDEVLGLVRPETRAPSDDNSPGREASDDEAKDALSRVHGIDNKSAALNDPVTIRSVAELSTGSVTIDGEVANLVDLRGLLDVPAFVAVGSTRQRVIETLE